MVVRLRAVHALVVFPGEVAEQAQGRQDDGHEVEERGGEEARHRAGVFGGEAEFGGGGGVGGDEDEPDDHGAGDGEEGVFGPDVGDESGFAEHGREDGGVERGAPDPVAGDLAVGLRGVVEPDGFREEVGEEGVVEAVADPGEEGVHAEEGALLAEAVELRVAIEEAGGDKLVEDAHDQGRKDGEEDIVEGEGPGFVDDFAGEGVLEGILYKQDCQLTV